MLKRPDACRVLIYPRIPVFCAFSGCTHLLLLHLSPTLAVQEAVTSFLSFSVFRDRET